MNITRTVIMPNYKQGKIYKIVSNTDDELCYIGSTTRPLLCQRMEQHRSKYKQLKSGGKTSYTTSFILFNTYGVENCRIELIELFPCNSKDELTKKEGEYIRSLECVNKQLPGRTKSDWYVDNKDAISQKVKEYRGLNGDTIREREMKYRVVNRETIRGKKKKDTPVYAVQF